MNKAAIAVLVVLALAGGFGASKLLQHQAGISGGPNRARPLPMPAEASNGVDFSLPMLDGSPLALSASDGRVRVLNFWATWCAPCRREIPLLKQLAEEHGAAGIDVVGLAVDDADPVSAYAAEAQFNYPVVMAEPGAAQIVADYGLDFIGLPLTLIVAPDRELIYAHAGELKSPELDAMLPALLALAAGAIDAEGARSRINAAP